MELKQFFTELKRRNVYRVGAAYAVVAWLLIQVATQTLPFFEVPTWAVRLVIVVLAAGFVPAVILAWLYEITPQGIVRTIDVPEEEQQSRHRRGRFLDFVIIGVLALAVAVLLFDRFRPGGADAPGKSIAVLPFQNLSADPANDSFADGIHEDVLTSLARIDDLKVISRTSVMPYRDAQRNLRDIAKTLGVSTILEGSVRREGDQVAVNVQLIDAVHDRQLWANRYDRTVSSALTLQAELANEIAGALHASLSPEEKARVAVPETKEPQAAELFRRARLLRNDPEVLVQNLKLAEQLLSEAIELDPQFAGAYALRSITRAAIFHFHEATPHWRETAWADADKALRLRDDLNTSHLAGALCAYWIDRDYQRALAGFATASKLAPNDVEPAFFTAAIHRREGRWQLAIDGFERVAQLDPRNPTVLRNLAFTYSAVRDWPAAAKAAERWANAAPESVHAAIQNGYIHFSWRGDTSKLKEALARIPAELDPEGFVSATRWDLALIERDFAAADRAIDDCKREELSYLTGLMAPKAFFRGCTAFARGDPVEAAALLAEAIPNFERSVQDSPGSAEQRANLALVLAMAGRAEDAQREGARAVEMEAQNRDAIDKPIIEACRTAVYAFTGMTEPAVRSVDRLLRTPGATDSTFYTITVQDLRLRWTWDKLRGDATFQELMRRHQDSAPAGVVNEK